MPETASLYQEKPDSSFKPVEADMGCCCILNLSKLRKMYKVIRSKGVFGLWYFTYPIFRRDLKFLDRKGMVFKSWIDFLA